MTQNNNNAVKFGCTDYCNTRSCCKLKAMDWLHDVNQGLFTTDVVEIRFKNTRKEFFKNINKLNLEIGDIVAVEALPGHDIGTVSMTGQLVKIQMKKNNIALDSELKKIYRKAKPTDIEKWDKAIAKEPHTMLRARQIADDLKLNMKIGDVEYQGDGTKAIFYYIADERVDFRELIKIFAEQFKVRIEMKQIGARQEAGRIGGIGSCGRELCCATWMNKFVSVTTVSAKAQDLSLNPQKLAGQCGKLKCCLNYEHDSYVDAQKDFPDTSIVLQTEQGRAFHQKTDIYKRIMWYSINENTAMNLVPVDVDRVKEIIDLNRKNIIVEYLNNQVEKAKIDVLKDEDLEKNIRKLKNSNKRRRSRKPKYNTNKGNNTNNNNSRTNSKDKSNRTSGRNNNAGKQSNKHLKGNN